MTIDVYGAIAGILHVATNGATASPNRRAVGSAPLAAQVKLVAGPAINDFCGSQKAVFRSSQGSGNTGCPALARCRRGHLHARNVASGKGQQLWQCLSLVRSTRSNRRPVQLMADGDRANAPTDAPAPARASASRRPRLCRRPGVAAVGGDAHLAAAVTLPGHRNADGDLRAVELPILAGHLPFRLPDFPRAQLDSCLMQAAPLHQTISDCRSTSRRDSTSFGDATAPVC